jgi:hypothetical protein
MKFTLKREDEFIPKWNGNDKQDEPIKFTIRALNTVERDSIFTISHNLDGVPLVKTDFLKAFRIGVVRVSGLTVDGAEVSKAEEVIKLPGFYELVLEVGTEVIARNPFEQNSKN